MKCKNCGHEIIDSKEIEKEFPTIKLPYYHFYKPEGFFEKECFICGCKNPLKKQGKE